MNGYNAYVQNNVTTLSPMGLIVALYDRCLLDLQRAKTAIDQGNIAERGRQTSHALSIIAELAGSVDHGPDPDLAKRLISLYDAASSFILEANIKGDAKMLTAAEKVLTPLREAWSELLKKGFDGRNKAELHKAVGTK